MTAQRGRDLLIKIDANNDGTYTAIAGMRSRSIRLNSGQIDITNNDSTGQWRELLGEAATKTAEITGSGIFKDAESDALMRQTFFNGSTPKWQLVLPDFGTLTGAFQITRLEYAGSHASELTFEMTLLSAGEVEFGALNND